MKSSKIISALNVLGYNKETVEKRAWIGMNGSEGSAAYHRKTYGEDIDIVLTGSRREGIATSFDNDVDQMFIDNAVLCIEPKEVASCKDINKFRAVFLLDTRSAPAGYTFLELYKLNAENAGIPIEIKDALTSHNGSIIVRNDKVRLKAISPLRGTVQQKRSEGGWVKKTFELNVDKHGPSASFALELPYLNSKLYYDDCLAFQCRVASLTKSWIARKRNFDWPSVTLISQIENMASHVVPVGMKGHQEHVLQWRICFTIAEIALVESFNDSQIKVYAVMKNLTRSVFKKVCHGITSYIMKNVLFWISEEVPMVEFQTKDFPARLRHAFYYLKNCISRRHLPSYMIAKRNLLEGKVSDMEQKQLLQLIQSLLADGPSVALRIPEVLEQINHPDEEVRKGEYQRRKFAEQAFSALFALPPTEMADVLRLLLDAPTQAEFLEIYMKRVIPYIRSHNPQGFFTYFLADDFQIYQLIFDYMHAKF